MNFKEFEKSLNERTFRDYYKKLKLLAKSVYKWNNLPNGIDERWIEEFLFSEGKCMFFMDKSFGLMVAKCVETGVNPYDEPTNLMPVSSSPDVEKRDFVNYEEAILIRNNDDMLPTSTSVMLYAYRLTDLTRTIDINISAQKTPVLILCKEKQKLTLKNIYKQWNGFEPVIYGDKEIDLSGVKVLKTDAPIVFDKLQIEKNHIWNECMTFLGINNANMDKRERLVDDEVQANNEQVEMFALMGLKARQRACELINAKFNTNISVEFREAENEDMSFSEGAQEEGEQ